MVIARRRATEDDLLAVPEHLVGELIDGELIVSPRPAIPHSLAASVLGSDLNGPFHRGRGGPGGWWIFFEPELKLGGDVLIPDLAGWRRERLPVMPRVPRVPLAPDWVCEVLSPSTGRTDRVLKLPIYARAQIPWLWLIDPQIRVLEILHLKDGEWSLHKSYADDAKFRGPPFDAVELELGPLWDLGEGPAGEPAE